MAEPTDIALRAIVLKRLYDQRKTGGYDPHPGQALPCGSDTEFFRICEQLVQAGLIRGEVIRAPIPEGGYGPVGGNVEITAFGVDIVEDSGSGSPIPMDFSSITQNIHINNSAGIQVGSHNNQSIVAAFQSLVENIDATDATPEQKKEAKGLLEKLVEHPVVVAILGAAAGSIVDAMNR